LETSNRLLRDDTETEWNVPVEEYKNHRRRRRRRVEWEGPNAEDTQVLQTQNVGVEGDNSAWGMGIRIRIGTALGIEPNG